MNNNQEDIVTSAAKPKRRSRSESTWKCQQTKVLKAKGREHLRYKTGTVVHQRLQKHEMCRHKCHGKLTLEEKKTVFQKFNDLASHNLQNVYLQSCTIPLENRRFDYILQLQDRIEVVCQKIFLGVHGIKRSRLQRKVLNRTVDIKDCRGRHNNHKKLSTFALEAVKAFIENLEARPSHYSRSQNHQKKFLESKETLKSLYKNFLFENPELSPNADGESVLLWKFVHIFNYHYNIGFGYPRSDVCDSCEIFTAELGYAVMLGDEDTEMRLRLEQQEHWIDAQVFFNKMSKTVTSLTDDKHIYICFDYEKNLPFPVTNVGKEFFMRQMWLNNFGVRNLRSGETKMFSYCEHYAKKGSAEVISFIKYYIETFIPATIRHLHLFCDNSYGQNKNRFLIAYLYSICPTRFSTITFDLPLPGHSRMSIDADFAQIERKKLKMDKIEYPSEWIDLIRNAKIAKPFEVIYVQHPVTNDLCDDGTPIAYVYDFKTSLTPLLQNSTGQISAIKGLFYDASGCKYRDTMNGSTTKLFKCLRNGVTLADLQETIAATPMAYHDFLPINASKYENLQSLLETFYRPPESIFYDSINVEEMQNF